MGLRRRRKGPGGGQFAPDSRPSDPSVGIGLGDEIGRELAEASDFAAARLPASAPHAPTPTPAAQHNQSGNVPKEAQWQAVHDDVQQRLNAQPPFRGARDEPGEALLQTLCDDVVAQAENVRDGDPPEKAYGALLTIVAAMASRAGPLTSAGTAGVYDQMKTEAAEMFQRYDGWEVGEDGGLQSLVEEAMDNCRDYYDPDHGSVVEAAVRLGSLALLNAESVKVGRPAEDY